MLMTTNVKTFINLRSNDSKLISKFIYNYLYLYKNKKKEDIYKL
jgi:hypothetical protein